jgi:superfamily II DNA/RNA helicase
MAMWRTYSERYELDAHVLSMGDLSTTTAEMLLDQFPTRNFVLIDESHNFRNSNTARYRALEGFLRGRPSIRCCLLTATPRNKSARDILNQIRLFHPEDATELPIDPPNIAEYFKLVEAGARPLPALLANLLVRRTRSHVLRWYGFDAQTDQPVNPSEFAPYERGERRAYVKVANKRQFFPSRRLQTVEYSIDATYNGLYKTILDALNGQTPTGHAPQDGFRYARYGLRNYIHPHMQAKEPYRSLARAGANLHGLIRVLLFKRFESSVSAFRTTLERMANQNKGFLRAVEGGLMPAGDDAQRLLNELADTEDDFSPELREASTAYDIAAFDVERLTTDLRQDIATIERLLTLIAPITPAQDAKLQRLLQLLAEPAPGGKKWLIFTQYTDTATYLHAHLNPHHRPDIAVVTGSDGANKAQIVARFSPANNPNFRPPADAQPIDTLIATDVLSEGLNMQECNRIINYDLHWNPVRLIQRFGRIDRIGTDHEVIHGYNFLPETELDRNLGLRQKLEQRIRDINDTIGEDAAILDPSEQPNTAAMYAIYEANGQEPTVLSWESEEAELALIDINELEEKLRALRQNDPEEFERIRALPDGLRSHLQRGQRGTFVMCKAGDFTQFYHADASGEPVLKEPSEALALIFSEDREPATTLPADHAQYILKAKQAFTKTYQQRLAAANTAYARSRVQKVIYERLMWQRNTQLDPDLKAQIDRLAAAFTSRKLSGELTQKLKELQLDHIELPALIAALDNLYVRYKLDQSTAKTTDTFDIPYVVCSEAIT